MGYRVRLGRIPKSAKIKYAKKSYKQIQKMIGDNHGVAYPPDHEQLFEMGKYLQLRKKSKRFYSFDITKYEYEFHIIDKKALKLIIEEYHNMILSYFQNLKTEDFENYKFGKIQEWKFNNWNVRPYYLDEERTDGFIVRSWKYEYAIFNLVHIYKTFDWDNDYLIYSGW